MFCKFERAKGENMTKKMPLVRDYMTKMPHTIGEKVPLLTAMAMMSEFQIRHLPVLSSGKLVGILTDRDVKLATSFENASGMKVEDVMVFDPYAVKEETPLGDAALAMAKHKYGCAIVESAPGKVSGIFTASDGLQVLGELLTQAGNDLLLNSVICGSFNKIK